MSDIEVTAQAAKLIAAYGESANRAAKAGLEAARKPEDVEYWIAVCATLSETPTLIH
jgi:hypothetical protein